LSKEILYTDLSKVGGKVTVSLTKEGVLTLRTTVNKLAIPQLPLIQE